MGPHTAIHTDYNNCSANNSLCLRPLLLVLTELLSHVYDDDSNCEAVCHEQDVGPFSTIYTALATASKHSFDEPPSLLSSSKLFRPPTIVQRLFLAQVCSHIKWPKHNIQHPWIPLLLRVLYIRPARARPIQSKLSLEGLHYLSSSSSVAATPL